MAKYISLIKYTAKGIENIKESPDRLDGFKQLCESMGAKVEGFYLTMALHLISLAFDYSLEFVHSNKHISNPS